LEAEQELNESVLPVCSDSVEKVRGGSGEEGEMGRDGGGEGKGKGEKGRNRRGGRGMMGRRRVQKNNREEE